MLMRHALAPKAAEAVGLMEGVVGLMVEVVALVEEVDDADTKLPVSYRLRLS